MKVFVRNKRGQALMPCSPRKARKLLKENKAKVVDYKPFTIQLEVATGETVQEVRLGIDSGARYAGVAIVIENKVLIKGTIELRTDVKDLLTSRRNLRRTRRLRKTRYRRCKFPNGKGQKSEGLSNRPEGWLPPSIRSRLDSQLFWIRKFRDLLPNPKVIIEVGKFDVQKMINPNIEGVGYQQGDAYGFWNTRYYVFARDKYTCQICKKKDGILQTHHIIQRKDGGTDRAENLATVHLDCHEKFHKGEINHTFKKPKLYRETSFMNIFRKRVFRELECEITYGSITTPKRKELELEKSHFNDAIAITGIEKITSKSEGVFYIKQFRKKKRSLHEQIPRKGRKKPNIEAKRNKKNTPSSRGFHLNDKVSVFGRIGFISGFCSGGVYIKDIDSNYITKPDKSYKQVSFKDLEFICHNNNWQFIPHL